MRSSPPAATEILGPEVDRLAALHINARSDRALLAVWLKSDADGSPHTIRVYQRVGERFLGALVAAGSTLRQATVEYVQAALDAMQFKEDGSAVRPATVKTYVAAMKSFLGFAHRVVRASMPDRSSSSRRRHAKSRSAS